MLAQAARLLLPLQEEFVFLGGLALALLVSDPAAPDVRPTEDVDVIVHIGSYARYSFLKEKLRANGFSQPREEAAIICRWLKDDLTFDIMRTDAEVLGFSNRWYAYAMKSASLVSLAENLAIQVVSAPCFLATKIEAFQSGTRGDFWTSRDLEDVVSVLDGRSEIVAEVQAAQPAVQTFLAETF